jgi:hypothetical protein
VGYRRNCTNLCRGLGERLNPDRANGLTAPSVIRLEYLFVVAEQDIAGHIGQIPPAMHTDLLQRLADHLTGPRSVTP